LLAWLLVAVAAFAAAAVTSPAAAHARGNKKGGAARGAKKAAPAPRQPKVVPNQEGKVVVLPFKDDDDHSIGALVERLLQARGLEVVANVRGVDTAEQFREVAGTLNLAAFVEGSVKDGGKASRVSIALRSGYTGRRVAVANFKEPKLYLRTQIEEKLWTRLGPAMARACVDATKPRKRGRSPLMIEAGTPLASGREGSDQ
jgi:hypothetical protein